MTTEKVKRKLTAILSADVKGYSRLMGADEVGTIRILQTYRGVISDLIQKKGGRVVDSPGDNVLAEFASVVDALEAAVEIQRELKVRNADRSESRRMEFRIGINLGDVVEEGERIYGDGVNIAARIEGLAEGGGICISGTAFDQIGKRLPLGYEYMGEQEVKNIEKPVRVYRVLMEPEQAGKVIGEKAPKRGQLRWAVAAVIILVCGAFALWNFYLRPPKIEPASKEKMAHPLPDKPSIAVLPFTNMSDDPKQEFFADGLAEEIINALARVPQVFVIARNSSFTYKGKPVKVQQVAEELGVQYVLEGSVRREEKRLRITAQLIDAITGRHVFSERYDRGIKEIFTTQDEIAIKILTALRATLKDEQWAAFHARGVTNVDAYFKLLEASELTQKVNKEDNAQARRLAEEALEPGSSRAYQVLATTHFWDYWLGPPKSREESTAMGIEMARKAIALDKRNPYPHGLLGMLYINQGEYDRAVEAGERAATMEPNSAHVLLFYGSTLFHACQPAEAIPVLTKALRLSPVNPPSMVLSNLAASHGMLGQYEEAVDYYKRLLRDHPRHFAGNLGLIATYALMGRREEAQSLAEQYLKTNPKFSMESYAKTIRRKDPAEAERFLAALRKAGLPDKPPLPLPDKPSIAVLPFVNMSDNKSQEYFSDGLTEEIITALSKTPKLFVIARNSTFVYKGKPVNVQQVSRELGVKYVLEGSVRRSGDQLRITAQLIDATAGNHLWAERYDRVMKDVFAIQDEITMKILTSLQVTLTEGEGIRMMARGTKNLDAYLRYLQASDFLNQMNRESNIRAREPAEEAIRLDPHFPAAYSVLASINMMDMWLQISKASRESLLKAIELHQKALSLDDSFAVSHAFLGFLYVQIGEHEKGVAEAERAVTIAPNFATGYSLLAQVLNYSGRPEEAITNNERAFRLNPMGRPSFYYAHAAHTHTLTARYEDGVKVSKEGLSRYPDNTLLHARLAMLYAALDRKEEARCSVQDVLRIDPKFSAQRYAKSMPYKDPALTAQALELMRRAGLPE